MVIEYKNKKIEKICKELNEAKKKYPTKIAIKLHQAIDYIDASKNLQEVIRYKPFRFHDLKGDRAGQYSIDIGSKSNGYRLIVCFKENKEDVFKSSIEITEIYIKELGNHYE